MFTLERLQSALEIFKSLYPDYKNYFEAENNSIVLLVDDFRDICSDFDDFYYRKCFTMTANTYWSEGMKYVITDCDLTLLKNLQKNWNNKWHWLDENGYTNQKPKKGLGYDYVTVDGKPVNKETFNKSIWLSLNQTFFPSNNSGSDLSMNNSEVNSDVDTICSSLVVKGNKNG